MKSIVAVKSLPRYEVESSASPWSVRCESRARGRRAGAGAGRGVRAGVGRGRQTRRDGGPRQPLGERGAPPGAAA